MSFQRKLESRGANRSNNHQGPSKNYPFVLILSKYERVSICFYYITVRAELVEMQFLEVPIR